MTTYAEMQPEGHYESGEPPTQMVESLRWKKFPVLDQGGVALVDVMGDDSSVVQAARTSYGEGTKRVSDDRGLIRYLMRHTHTTPLEMAEVKLWVRVPMDCWRQWIRHRTASVNEYSTRYSEAIDACQTTDPGKWRLQSGSNKQGSSGFLEKWPEGSQDVMDLCGGYPSLSQHPGDFLSSEEQELQKIAREVYETRLELGVAREQARKDLPLSTYTEAYWKCDLHNLLRFLSLRMDSHAQQEIRQYATVIGEQIVAPLFPLCWEAFNDYDARRGGLLLSRLDVEVIRQMSRMSILPMTTDECFENACKGIGWPSPPEKCRERDECLEKLKRLGIL